MWRNKLSGMQYKSDIISLWNVCQHYVFVDVTTCFIFPKRVLVITRHNEMKNLTAEMLDKVGKNVVIEPLLTPLTGEEFPKSSNTRCRCVS